MDAIQNVDLSAVIKTSLFQELSNNKHLPRRKLVDEVVYKYYILRPAAVVDRWVAEWLKSNNEAS